MSQISFTPPLADASAYPPVLIRSHPSRPFDFLRWPRAEKPLAPQAQLFHSGRAALFAAAQRLATTDSTVLLPAYHCPALVEPFIAAGYQIRFYPLSADLSVDVPALLALLTPKVSHVLTVRFFGHSLNVDPVLAMLAERDIITFDDCAHDLQSFLQIPLAASARICSLKKFLAVTDGGLLEMRQPALLPATPAGWWQECRSLLSLLRQQSRQGWRHARPVSLYPLPEAPMHPTHKTARVEDVLTTVANDFRYLTCEHRAQAGLTLSRLQLRLSDLPQVFRARQQNARQLTQALQSSSLGQLLWPQCPSASAPYVLPFVLRDRTGFDLLRQRGVQVLRWEELAPADCPVSKHYRELLIQLPCHQELSAAALQQLIAVMQ